MVILPIPAEELAEELSRPLAATDRRRLDVQRVQMDGAVDVVPSDEDARVTLVLDILATADPHTLSERWRVRLPVSVIDLAPSVSRSTLLLILRANIEEWWDTKDQDPHAAALGERLLRGLE